jgi:hypothetical protein
LPATKVETPAPPASSAPPTSPTSSTTPTTTSTEQFEATTTLLKLKTPRASLQLTRGLRGYIQRMRSRAPTWKTKSKDRRKAFSIEPAHESLTPSQAPGKRQASQSEQPYPATQRPLRQHRATPLQCVLMDSDAREDIPAADTVALLLFPFLPFPLASIKWRGGQPSQGLTNRTLILRDLGSTPSPDQFVTPTTNNPSTGTQQLDTRRRVLLLGGPNQYKSHCLLC